MRHHNQEYPEEVLKLKKSLKDNNDLKNFEIKFLYILEKSTEPSATEDKVQLRLEQINMWHSIKKAEIKYQKEANKKKGSFYVLSSMVKSNQSDWLTDFLKNTVKCQKDKNYQNISRLERAEIKEKIQNISRELSLICRSKNINPLVTYVSEGKFKGFHVTANDYLLENRDILDNADIPFSDLLEKFYEEAVKEIDKVDSSKRFGKASKNASAVGFVREIHKINMDRYGKPHLSIIATLANSLYGTSYDKTNISNLTRK